MEDDLFGDITDFLKNPKSDHHIISEEELDFAILAFLETRGDEGADEEEILRFVRWLEAARLNNAFVDLFFKGLVQIDDKTGTFAIIEDDNLVIRLSETGKSVKNELQ